MPLPQENDSYRSRAYDFHSVMTYPSGVGWEVGGVPQYPLLIHSRRLSHGLPTDPENLIHQGDDQDPWKTGPTQLDIERVRALYPKQPQSTASQSTAPLATASQFTAPQVTFFQSTTPQSMSIGAPRTHQAAEQTASLRANRRAILAGHRPSIQHDSDNLPYEGGKSDPQLASPSQMDIGRVKAFYPEEPQSVVDPSSTGGHKT